MGFEEDLKAMGIDHKATMDKKREGLKMPEKTVGAGEEVWQRDYWSQTARNMADEKDTIKEVRGYYLESKAFKWTEKDGTEKDSLHHLILSKRVRPDEEVNVLHLLGSADMNRFLEGKPRGMAVRIVFLGKVLEKGKPHNKFDFFVNEADKADPASYPGVTL